MGDKFTVTKNLIASQLRLILGLVKSAPGQGLGTRLLLSFHWGWLSTGKEIGTIVVAIATEKEK